MSTSRFTRPSLSPDRAFVVQLQQPGATSPEKLSGRVEHIASGRSAQFFSLTDLYEFMGAAPRSHLQRPAHGLKNGT